MSPILLLLSALIYSAVSQCPANDFQRLEAPTGTISCCGSAGAGKNTWALGGLGSQCSISLSANFSFYYDNTFLAFSNQGGKNLQRWTKGQKPADGWSYTGSDVRIEFITVKPDNCDTRFSLTYSCSPAPKVYPIQSATEYRVVNDSASGFVYLTLARELTLDGASLQVRAVTEAYKGLKPPAFFIGKNYVPSLENSDFSNKTVPDGTGVFRFDFSKVNPEAGQYVIAMFSYGRFSSVIFEATWKYNYPPLVNDVVNTLKISSSAPWTAQVQLTKQNSKFLLEVSREEPGGITTVLVGAGFAPTVDKFTKKKVVSLQDGFGEIAFDRPIMTGDNPGLFVVRAVTTNATAGALIRGTWK